jgi:microcystin-dependent protein
MGPFIGQIEIFAFEFAPNGWVICDGRLLSIQEFQALFQLIGTTYGGDGQTTFAVPKIPPVVPNGPAYYMAAFGQAPKK